MSPPEGIFFYDHLFHPQLYKNLWNSGVKSTQRFESYRPNVLLQKKILLGDENWLPPFIVNIFERKISTLKDMAMGGENRGENCGYLLRVKIRTTFWDLQAKRMIVETNPFRGWKLIHPHLTYSKDKFLAYRVWQWEGKIGGKIALFDSESKRAPRFGTYRPNGWS